MVKDLGKLKSNQTDAVLGGYLAEHWHAGTFNINAAATESLHRAKTLGSTEYASVDIATNFGQSYSSKYMGTSEQSATAQAAYSRDLGAPKYQGQEQVVPSDQLDGAIAVAKQRAMKNADSRPEVASSYEYTSQHLTDRISDGEVVESKPLSKKESIALAKKVKEKGEDLSGEDVGVSFSNSVTNREIFKKIMDAGYSAAFVTVAMQLAPDIYKAIILYNGSMRRRCVSMALPGTPGQRISDLCNGNHITQKELAEKIGVSASQLSRIVSGETRTVSSDILIGVAKEFKVSTDYILGLSTVSVRKSYDISELGLSEGAVRGP